MFYHLEYMRFLNIIVLVIENAFIENPAIFFIK